jgi:hypothetical protein
VSDFYDTQPEIFSRFVLQNWLLECAAKAEKNEEEVLFALLKKTCRAALRRSICWADDP